MSTRILLLLLITWVFVISTHAFRKDKKVQLRYACKLNGDISALNPDKDYKYAYAYDSVVSTCQAQVLKNASVIKITNCSDNNLTTPIKIILSSRPFRNPILIGGKYHKIAIVRCSYGGQGISNLVDMSISAKKLFRNLNGFPEGFASRDNNVTIEMFDVTGEPGYRIFTIAYPIGLTITGPSESDIYPEVCRAYSSKKVGTGLVATLLRDGCSLKHGLMFNFSKEEEDWYDRNITEVDLSRFILEPGMYYDDYMEREEEEEPLPPPPMLHTHLYAFRFYLSGSVSIECEVRVCPVGSIDCYLPCDPAQMTTASPTTPTTAPTIPTAATTSSTVAPSTEVVPQPEPEVVERKKRAIDIKRYMLYSTEDTGPIGKDFIIRGTNPVEPEVPSELYDDEAELHVTDENLELATPAETVTSDIVTETPNPANRIIIKGKNFWEIIVKAKLQVRKPTELTTAGGSLGSTPPSQTSVYTDNASSSA